MRYAIFDPTGNVTALVEDPVARDLHQAVARRIMVAHPEVEQVGFVESGPCGGASGRLTMAGGEFCGNATMSAAALLALRGHVGSDPGALSLRLWVSGAQDPVEVRMRSIDGTTFEGAVRMPPARSVERVVLAWADVSAEVPVVFMEGISHAVVDEGSPFARLAGVPEEAEAAVRAWCATLGADGLGIMFLDREGSERTLTPLVFVPGADTCFWERSCASGTSACGMYEAALSGGAVDLACREPGGILRVTSEPEGPTWLFGHVRETGRFELM